MIKETYLAVKEKVVRRGDTVLDISRFRKKKQNISPLAPSFELLSDWNQDRIVWKDYVERYYGELKEKREAGLLIEEIAGLAARQDVWLVCLERDYPCHRFLVKEVVEKILVARGELERSEDYSEHYRLWKNLTRSEIKARKRPQSKRRSKSGSRPDSK